MLKLKLSVFLPPPSTWKVLWISFAMAASSVEWRAISRGDGIPEGAIFGGRTQTDDETFVGRNKAGEVGKINSRDGKMYNLWCHKSKDSSKGEILIVKKGCPIQWVKVSKGDDLPPDALYAGDFEGDGAIYPCRWNGAVGKLNLDGGKCNNMWFHGEWFAKHDGEVLVVGPPRAGQISVTAKMVAPSFFSDSRHVSSVVYVLITPIDPESGRKLKRDDSRLGTNHDSIFDKSLAWTSAHNPLSPGWSGRGSASATHGAYKFQVADVSATPGMVGKDIPLGEFESRYSEIEGLKNKLVRKLGMTAKVKNSDGNSTTNSVLFGEHEAVADNFPVKRLRKRTSRADEVVKQRIEGLTKFFDVCFKTPAVCADPEFQELTRPRLSSSRRASASAAPASAAPANAETKPIVTRGSHFVKVHDEKEKAFSNVIHLTLRAVGAVSTDMQDLAGFLTSQQTLDFPLTLPTDTTVDLLRQEAKTLLHVAPWCDLTLFKKGANSDGTDLVIDDDHSGLNAFSIAFVRNIFPDASQSRVLIEAYRPTTRNGQDPHVDSYAKQCGRLEKVPGFRPFVMAVIALKFPRNTQQGTPGYELDKEIPGDTSYAGMDQLFDMQKLLNPTVKEAKTKFQVVANALGLGETEQRALQFHQGKIDPRDGLPRFLTENPDIVKDPIMLDYLFAVVKDERSVDYILRKFLTYGADAAAKLENGGTTLMAVAVHGWTEVAMTLAESVRAEAAKSPRPPKPSANPDVLGSIDVFLGEVVSRPAPPNPGVLSSIDVFLGEAVSRPAPPTPSPEELEQKADRAVLTFINARRESDGKTALMIAVEASGKERSYSSFSLFSSAGFPEFIRMLLSYGADTNIADNDGKTVWDLIKEPQMILTGADVFRWCEDESGQRRGEFVTTYLPAQSIETTRPDVMAVLQGEWVMAEGEEQRARSLIVLPR